jgi:hypothetical protein
MGDRRLWTGDRRLWTARWRTAGRWRLAAFVGGVGVIAAVAVPVAASVGGVTDSRAAMLGSTAKCVLPRPPSATTQDAPETALLSILAVLRRPMTHADALPARAYLSFNQEVFVRYIRLARSVGGFGYYVIPAIITRCEPVKAYQGVTFVRRTPGGGGAGILAASAASIKRYGGFFTSGQHGRSTAPGLVPDGVATVTVHYAANPAGRLPAVTITAKVVDNVVVLASIPRGPAASWTKMVWRAANGTTIKTFSDS